ncbi:MAG: hypothetical protein S4CHLAM123_04590 [Chlamydiales bacterium]|nr:hypothetical protein [Chlamydiales bacterium]
MHHLRRDLQGLLAVLQILEPLRDVLRLDESGDFRVKAPLQVVAGSLAIQLLLQCSQEPFGRTVLGRLKALLQ